MIVHQYPMGYCIPIERDGSLVRAVILDYGFDVVKTTWIFNTSVGRKVK